MRRVWVLLLGIMLAGCPVRETTQPVDVPNDLDGDGKADTVTVTDDKITINTTSLAISPEEGSFGEAKVIDIDKSTKTKEVLVEENDVSDASLVHIFTYDGKKISKSEPIWGWPDIDGGGKAVVVDENCGQTTTSMYAVTAGKVKLESEKTEGEFNEDECVACPYVYVKSDRGFVYQGEILRDLRNPELEAVQSLPLRAFATDGILVVKIAERKHELTYIDLVYLTVNGRRIEPNECANSSAPYCASDQRMLLLGEGSEELLSFDVGTLAEKDHVELWSEGYYIALPR